MKVRARKHRREKGRMVPSSIVLNGQDRTETEHYERNGRKMVRQLVIHRGTDRAIIRSHQRHWQRKADGRYAWP